MIIVTGGAGFIGSNILAELDGRGYRDLVVVDWLGSGDKWRNIAKRELRDIVQPEQLMAYVTAHWNEIRAIIHMGAISSTVERDVDLIVRSNVALSWELWCFCRDHKKQFIYASSAATYGDGALGFADRDDLDYLRSLRPLNPYGWSKALFDIRVARERLDDHAFPAQSVGLKFFNVYGPNEYHKGGQKSVVAHIFPSVSKGEPVELFKSYHPDYQDGGQLRDFVWVGDCVSVIVWMLEHPDVSGLFNVGSGAARSFFDLAKATWNALDKAEQIRYKEMPAELRDKYQYYTKADIGKLRQAGYAAASTTLEAGVTAYVQKFLASQDTYR
jgi:ADP-L-glycero-D-manno-heptose 6-epimerase